MKVLIFSHIADIDGCGCVVLAKQSFEFVNFELVNHNDINSTFSNYISTNVIDNYDKIFVTDICIKQPLLEQISKRKNITSKLVVLDHHAFEMNNGANNYPFVNIVEKDENGVLCSGTSLFYEYLIKGGYLAKSKKFDEFVELTRQSDTWDWKKFNNKKADDLAQLFNATNALRYIDEMTKMLSHNVDFEFDFTKEQRLQIENYRQAVRAACEDCAKRLEVVNLNNLTIGVSTINYNFRNDMSQYVRDNNIPIDVLALPDITKGTCSFRSINPLADVNVLANMFGGGGHKQASACPLSQKLMDILNIKQNQQKRELN